MSDDYRRIELITGTARRRHWSTEQKLQIIEESFEPGETVSSVARRRGVAPNLLYRWRRLMTEGGATAVGSDEPVVGSSGGRGVGGGNPGRGGGRGEWRGGAGLQPWGQMNRLSGARRCGGSKIASGTWSGCSAARPWR